MIPFLDLKPQHEALSDELSRAVDRVLQSGTFVLGEEVEAFETEFARYCRTPFAVGVNSGASAIELALSSAGIGAGDEVLTTPFSFVGTASTIETIGATPVFVDIEPVTGNIDPLQIPAKITPRTRAILPVHLYGQPADMDSINAIAKDHGLVVIEDAAHAHGAMLGDRPVGTLGDLGCFSFNPVKNLGACGDAGMVVTANADWAAAIRQARDWGQEGRNIFVRKGANRRMSAMQAAILRVKLPHLEEWNRLRTERALQYDSLLAASGVVRPAILPDRAHSWHLYVVRAARRDWLRDALAAREIETEIHYPAPIHRIVPWMDGRYGPGDFPFAERMASEVLSLPLYPELPMEAVAEVSRAIAEAVPVQGAHA